MTNKATSLRKESGQVKKKTIANSFKFSIFLSVSTIFIMIAPTTKAQSFTYTGCVIYQHGSGIPRLEFPIFTNAAGSQGTCNGYPVQVYSTQTVSKPLSSYCDLSSIPNAYSYGYTDPNYRNCIVNGYCGIITTVNVSECPLDNNVIIVLIISAASVAFILRQTKTDERLL